MTSSFLESPGNFESINEKKSTELPLHTLQFSKAGNLLNSFPGTKLHNLPSVQAQSAFKDWLGLFQGDLPHKYQSSICFAKLMIYESYAVLLLWSVFSLVDF
ncbi:uncharacterized protein EV154DRAFT_485023 [Mucor mucedo]|uniref:uncharacterized protein n=1 Tax=Mucor mucedo TaxID=29922 RepID=UPI0022203AAB|nr:uncharacterized protein EV154DRAFT_485023 [Mucor mucedo]KAI7887058.1 hypothetical protein EV154DRAFT_485023 [Mucor mucedo]